MNDADFWLKQPELDVLTAAYLLAGEPLPEQLSHSVDSSSYPPKVIATIKLIFKTTGAVVRVPYADSYDRNHRDPPLPSTNITQDEFRSLTSVLGISIETSDAPQAVATGSSNPQQQMEREKLLRQIGSLALLLADKAALYKRAGKPNASQIASAVSELIDVIPDAEIRGLGRSEMRESIASGLALLTGDLPPGK